MSAIELNIARNRAIVEAATQTEKGLLQAASNLFFNSSRPITHDELWSVMTLKVLAWVRNGTSVEEAMREALAAQRAYKAAVQAAASATTQTQPGKISATEKAVNTAAVLAALSKGNLP